MSARIDPARLEMIRAAATLNDAGAGPVYQDRADLLAHVDWLNERLVQAERELASSGIEAAAAQGADMSACCPVVVYFGNPKDRDDFIVLMQAANPNLTSRAVE